MEEILSSDVRKNLKKEFSALSGNVRLVAFTTKGLNDRFNDIAVKICEEFSGLNDKISFEHRDLGSDEAKKSGIDSSPVILFNPDKYNIRFMGAPIGEEGRSFVATIMMVSTGNGVLSKPSIERLKELKEPRDVIIFVTPT
ncbi:MAG TPA: hypothetical protein ENH07_08925 [Nitrospirae bacterium]|nr:hypothetical protein BMS3Bbin05_00069 [bacterium BMS3Bbin05]HDO22801.1 hypothetical protein [Nitrospirota bacterium]HDO36395.1 hypothetical protein [Nitrospirota bacterium]HDZ88724.1 hypothetical protein [Nitrospirota bacterium]